MAKILNLSILLLISSWVYSQPQKPDLPTPPNCRWLYDNLFMDETEMANIHWLEFIHFAKKDSAEEVFLSLLPDTTVWRNYDSTGQRKKEYLRHPAYRNHPVVGVTPEQAQAYCRWRTNAINRKLIHEKGGKTSSPQYLFLFRLPSEKEWEFAALGGLDISQYPYGFTDYLVSPTLKNEPKTYYRQLALGTSLSYKAFKDIFNNYLRNGKEPFFNIVKDFPTGTRYTAMQPMPISEIDSEKSPPGNSRPNSLGIRNMIGNVAEMVAEPGIAKGGSWAHNLEDSRILNRQYYQKPAAWLGFRCVCEVKRIKN
ncbi:MAG: formylglycine-generating enzyme family protein [Bacteroidota bacterium]